MAALAVMRAGSPLRSSASCEWSTPQDLFDRLAIEFGPFDLDPCATPENAKCGRFFTAADNGLLHRWSGRVYMNPPYGRTIRLWMRKARQSAEENGALVVCLVPARTDTRWWQSEVQDAGTLVRFLPGRLRFGGGNSAPFPSALVVYGRLDHRHPKRERACAWCRRRFVGRADAETCSPRCRQARHRSRLRRLSVTARQAQVEVVP